MECSLVPHFIIKGELEVSIVDRYLSEVWQDLVLNGGQIISECSKRG